MKQRAVFLDRDGVINFERGNYTFKKEDFEILPDVFSFISELKKNNYLVIVISNQGGIGRGLYNHQDFIFLQDLLNEELAKYNLKLDDYFYCPHYPDSNGNCICRKPDSLLFEKAIAKYNISPVDSFMIGDKERDIIPAQKLGIKGIKIEANSSLKNILSLLLK